jgi:signal transduction histidine kinase
MCGSRLGGPAGARRSARLRVVLGRVGIRRQLVLALVVPAILVVLAMAWFADLAIGRALDDSLGRRLISIAASAAAVLEPKLMLLERGDDELRVARSARRRLEELRAATGSARLLVVDLDGPRVRADSAGQLRVGDDFVAGRVDAPELARVRRGEGAASVLFRDAEGRWYKTGYAPLLDAEGAVVGAVVAQSAADFFDVIGEVRGAILAIVVFGLVGLFVLAGLAARRVTIPLSRLSAVAARIGGGELEVEIPTDGPAEAAVLGETMGHMARALAARDEQMQMMLAGIAHEVRNPLGGIELFGGLLREELEAGDPRRGHVDRILKEIDVLGRTVNDFLQFARRTPLEPKPTGLAELCEEVAALVRRDAATAGIELVVEAPRELIAELDPRAVHGALLNLCRNAIQATPPGGRVRLAARAEGAALHFVVEDTGPGVPVDKRESIWRPFVTSKQKGTGLGLALVRKTAEAHGGEARLEDAEDGGARFVLDLPIAARAVEPRAVVTGDDDDALIG